MGASRDDHGDDAFVVTPLDDADTRRLLTALEERVTGRAAPPAAKPTATWEHSDGTELLDLDVPDPELRTATRDLAQLPAPYYDPGRGGPVGGIVRRLVNVPIRLFGAPQSYFNDGVRSLLGRWLDVLRGLVRSLSGLEDELRQQRRRIDELTETVERLRRTPPESPHDDG